MTTIIEDPRLARIALSHNPPADEVLVDDTHAVVTRSAFDTLLSYDTSTPTGKTVGKRWKRRCWNRDADGRLVWLDEWQMAEIEECDPPEPGYIVIRWRTLEVVS